MRQVAPDRPQATVRVDENIKIAAWNVNTLHQAGKYENLKRERRRMGLDIIGVSEVRWTGIGECEDDEVKFIYSGGETHHRGVGLMTTKAVAKSIKGYFAISDRILVVKLAGAPLDINIVQVYAPTAGHDEDDIEEFYEGVDCAIKQCKSHELTIVMGDFNAKVGQGRDGETVGPWGLGTRNERGQKFSEWCQENNQVILNTWFQNHPRRLWTWKSPGDIARNQIDYITINKRFRNAVIQCRTKPGADLGSGCDHVPVFAKIKLKLKKVKKRAAMRRREWSDLKTEDIRTRYQREVKNKYQGSASSHVNTTVEAEWSNIKSSLMDAAEEILPVRPRRAIQPWMTNEILGMMDERQKLCKHGSRYLELDREIKRKCNERKEEWMNQRCEEVEQLEHTNTRVMHERIREVTGNKRATRSFAVIKDKEGNILMESTGVLKRWEEYIKELYGDESRGDRLSWNEEISGPPILKSEIEYAVKGMKSGKAAGEDGVVIEMVDAAGEFIVEKITRIANRIYDEGYIPEAMRESVFVTIPKKPGAIDCEKHRTISVMSQIGKVVLRVIRTRLKRKIEENLTQDQYGFRSGKGTTNAIFALNMIIERAVEKQKDLYLCFVDFEKAFDTVKHEEMAQMLTQIGVDSKDVRMIVNLYWEQRAAVRINSEKTDWVRIERGVRQGCVLSPDIFSLYSQKVMEEIEELEGVRVGGRNINCIRYADDTVLIADSNEKLQELTSTLDDACKRKGLRINFGKTEVMGITKRRGRVDVEVDLHERRVKQVSTFKYLGYTIGERANSEMEIIKRIAMAKAAFAKLKPVLKSFSISIETRVRILRCYVWSTMTYGCEAWTIRKDLEKRLETAEMWFYRRMLRIPWTARVTNVEVLRRAGVGRCLVNKIRRRQLKFLGHIVRAEELESDCLLGRIDGTRARGRQRMTYMDSILSFLSGDQTTTNVLRLARHREDWRSMVDNDTRQSLR